MINHAARGADHDVHAAAQGRQLLAVGLAAVNRQHAEAGHAGGIGLERFGDLDGQFTGRCQHQHLRLGGGKVDVGQHRQREGTGLAGTGLRLAEHVATLQHGGNGGGLDGRRRLVADSGYSFHHRL
ncbi:hypothetical protein D3C71_1472870 [compost metagenome]